jgi:COMPASS component SPP1
MKEAVLQNLTTREREIRKRIEDLLDPQARSMHSSTATPLKSANGSKTQVNGHAKTGSNGDVVGGGGKKGKKKRGY